MNLSPARKRTIRRTAVALLVGSTVLLGLVLLTVFSGERWTSMLFFIATVALVVSGAMSWSSNPTVRRGGREVFVLACAPLSGLTAFAGMVLFGFATGAVGFMGPGTADDEWMALSITGGFVAAGLAWWLARRELVTR